MWPPTIDKTLKCAFVSTFISACKDQCVWISVCVDYRQSTVCMCVYVSVCTVRSCVHSLPV